LGYEETFLPKAQQNDVHKVLQTLHLVNCMLRAEEFTESSLGDLLAQIKLLQTSIIRVFGPYSPTKLATPKVHSLIHFPMFIRLYGAPRNWDTATFEMFHKTAAKLPWLRVNRHEDADAAMLKVVDIRNTIAQMGPPPKALSKLVRCRIFDKVMLYLKYHRLTPLPHHSQRVCWSRLLFLQLWRLELVLVLGGSTWTWSPGRRWWTRMSPNCWGNPTQRKNCWTQQ
jgi:hypothetical protein